VFVSHGNKEIVLHIAFVGDAASSETWTRTIWDKTSPDQRNRLIDMHDAEVRRRAFSIRPSIQEIQGHAIRVAVDSLIGVGITQQDLDDLLRSADAVVVSAQREEVAAVLARMSRSATVIAMAEDPANPFPSFKAAVKEALLAIKAGAQPASYANGQADVLRAYLASSFVRKVVSKVIHGERETFDVIDGAGPSTSQVMSFAVAGGHLLVTSGFSARAIGDCRFELVRQVSGDVAAHVEGLAALGKQLRRSAIPPCHGGVVRGPGGAIRLARSALDDQVAWGGLDVERAVHPDTGVDGFFFRGTPFLLGFDLVPGEASTRVVLLDATPE
jgi:hypothetical protein